MGKVEDDVFSGSVSSQPKMVNVHPSGTMMYVEKSSSPKIIGILVICYYGLGLATSLLGVVGVSLLSGLDPQLSDEIGMPLGTMIIVTLLSLIPAVMGIMGGYQMYNYEKKGIWLVLGAIAIGWIVSTVSAALTSGYTGGPESAAVGAAFQGVCGIFCAGICGLIVCIPLFTANHGME